MLTPVGHEDLQASVLEQVSPGEDRSDLTEHPLTMQTLGVRQDLQRGEEKRGGKEQEGKETRQMVYIVTNTGCRLLQLGCRLPLSLNMLFPRFTSVFNIYFRWSATRNQGVKKQEEQASGLHTSIPTQEEERQRGEGRGKERIGVSKREKRGG